MSQDAAALLTSHPGYVTEERGLTEVKVRITDTKYLQTKIKRHTDTG